MCDDGVETWRRDEESGVAEVEVVQVDDDVGVAFCFSAERDTVGF